MGSQPAFLPTLQVQIESELLGTGGGLWRAKEQVSAPQQWC